MKKSTLLFFACVAIWNLGFTQCVDTLNIVKFTFEGNNYEIVKENKSWIDASACAVERGGILAEINSELEQISIFNEINSNAGININNTIAPDGGGGAYVWIGGNDLSIEGNWVWDGNNDGQNEQFWMGIFNGTPIGGLYNNWGDEPDDFGGQDGLGLSLNGWPLGIAGQWNDVDHTNNLYFIIEYNNSTTPTKEITNSDLQIQLYPNPVQDLLTIKIQDVNVSRLSLFSINGLLLKEIDLKGIELNDIEINTSDLKNGQYIVKITKTNGEHISRVLVK